MDKIFLHHLEKIELSLDAALPVKTEPEWQQNSFCGLFSSVNGRHIENLITPCRTLMDLGGKRWRPLLLVLCAELARQSGRMGGLSEEETYSITPLVEFVHTASLIHDDIEDSADVRRGKPAAHVTYGLDSALNAGSWLYFEAPVCINRLNVSAERRIELYSLYTQELRRLHLGQAMDIYWHRNPELIPSVEEYTAMVRCKTGTLASLAAKAGITAGGGTQAEAERAGCIAAEIGEGFQILDDVQNLTTGNPGKKRGDDIVEGKKSLPVLLHLASHQEDKEKIADCMKRASAEGIDSPAVEECISILESGNAIAEAVEKGRSCIKTKSAELADLFGSGSVAPAAHLIEKLFSDMIPEA